MIDQLIEAIVAKQNPTCVGLDTSFDYLPDEMKEGITSFEGAAEEIFAFNRGIVDAVCDLVPAVKVQIAYYEMYGEAGLRAFRKTCAYAKEKGLFVIADCKRNDIGSTASCYAKAYLGKTPVGDQSIEAFPADMLTVNGYLGSDGILPFTAECGQGDKGIFVLVKTSNPSGDEIQNLKLEDGRTIYELMGAMVEQWGESTIGKYGYSAVGAVVGATKPEEAKTLRKELKHTFFLIPGYGAQGANAAMLKNCFDENGIGGIVNNSRGILCAYRKKGGTYAEAARAAVVEMQKDLSATIGVMQCAK